jgi:phospholipid transport system substrate-binding protein
MVSQLNQHKTELHDSTVIHQIVNTTLVPIIDSNRMAGMVVGRQNWYAASPQERREFVALFKKYVINTYANALASFDDDHLQVYPLRGNISQRFVSVRSVIIRKSGQRIGISYNMVQSGGQWKVYDFSIEGVSIVQNYRSQFSSILASGGMHQLIQKLQNRAK